jgi:MFS superfamily sulfate permease-like transporter
MGCPLLEKFHLNSKFIGTYSAIPPEAYTLIVEYAAVLAVLGSIDSLLTSVIADNMTKTRHNSNRELIDKEIGNMLCCFGESLVQEQERYRSQY